MRFSEISSSLKCREFNQGENYESAEVENVTAGDLMSEVLVFDKENLLLVTSLNSEQALNTANMVDALGVLLVNAKTPGTAMISLAEELGVALLSTAESMFDACAALHSLLHKAG
jgi:hypothetical protein